MALFVGEIFSVPLPVMFSAVGTAVVVVALVPTRNTSETLKLCPAAIVIKFGEAAALSVCIVTAVADTVLLMFSVLMLGDCAANPNVTAPNASEPPEATLMLLVVDSSPRSSAIFCAAVALSLISPESKMRLPPSTNAPEPALNVMGPKAVSVALSLFGVSRTVPPNTSASLATGAVRFPSQFTGFVQLLSEPPPSQVRFAASNR